MKKQKKLLLHFCKIRSISYKNVHAKDCKFVKEFWEYSKFATKKWYVIDIETKGDYLHQNQIKFLIRSLEVFVIILMHIF